MEGPRQGSRRGLPKRLGLDKMGHCLKQRSYISWPGRGLGPESFGSAYVLGKWEKAFRQQSEW